MLTLWALVVLLFVGCGCAYAIEIQTGSNDWQFRLDNTIRYTLQYRLLNQNDSIISSINGDDGDRNFASGITSNRLDLLTEIDLINKPKNYGVRLSGAFWYDQRYHNTFQNGSPATSNFIADGVQQVGLYKFYDRYYAGPSGELLDAFVFAKFEPGGMPLYIKAGRHIYSWGESLLNPINGINYGQMPLDLAKAQALPGVEIKELFRPLNSLSAIWQLSTEIQLAGQYFLQWERNLLPGPGTYFGLADASIDGGGALLLAPGGAPGTYLTHGQDIEAARHRDFGLAFKYNPVWMNDTTVGLYYRRFSDKMPTIIADLADMTYRAAYKSNIDLYGISLATQYAGISIGAEISYRQHMPLQSGAAYVFSNAQLPDDGEVLSATGETLHGVFNMLGLLKKTPLWDAGSWMWEFNYSRWLTVTDDFMGPLNPIGTFKGADGYTGFDRVTKDAGNISIVFSPQWLQILPGLDMTMPLSLTYGIWGVSCVAVGNGEGDGNASIGFNFDYLTKYKFNFLYSNFFGKLGYDAATASAVARGNYALYRDRDFVSVTFKYSF